MAYNREQLKQQLQERCKYHWLTRGYRKTRIKLLCEDINISVGTFYGLYPTKEDIFFETIKHTQQKLEDQVMALYNQNLTIQGFGEALKIIVREYDKIPFLFDMSTQDFIAFVKKLPEAKVEALKNNRIDFFRRMIEKTNIELKVDEWVVYGTLTALFAILREKETLSLWGDYFLIFDFMVDNLLVTMFKA
jgi:AcrR family transcriptional regulator